MQRRKIYSNEASTVLPDLNLPHYGLNEVNFLINQVKQEAYEAVQTQITKHHLEEVLLVPETKRAVISIIAPNKFGVF